MIPPFAPLLARSWIVSLLLTAAALMACPWSGHGQLPGNLDVSFAPTVRMDGTVVAIVTQSDGKQLIGGDFSWVGSERVPNLIRLNSDGSLDAGFTPPAGLGVVTYIVVGANGKIFVLYEQFTTPIPTYTLVRLNSDGSVDASFKPPSFGGLINTGEIYAFVLAVQADGKVFVGGGFSDDPDSTATTYTIIRYNTNGSKDSGFALPATLECTQIDSLLPLSTGKVLVSGSFFDQSNGNSTALGLLRLNADGSQDTSYYADPIKVGAGYDLTLQPDGKLLYLTGNNPSFYLGGVPQRLNTDGSVDTSFSPQFSEGATFDTLILQPDGKVLVGGYTSVTRLSDVTTVKTGVVRLNTDGATDTTFKPASPLTNNPAAPLFDNRINALGLHSNGQILVGGIFKTFAGVLRDSIGRLNTNGSADPAFKHELTNPGVAYAVGRQGSGQPLLVTSGSVVNGAMASNLVGFDASGGLTTIFAANLVDDQYFDAGGYYASTNPALATQADGKVLLSGVFQPFTGYDEATVKRFNVDGSLDADFTATLHYYSVYKAVAPQKDGHIYLAGTFARGSNQLTYPLNRLNSDGSFDSAFQPANDPGATQYGGSAIIALAVQPNGKVIAAGQFARVNGQAQPSVMRFNANGSVDTTFKTGIFTNSDTGYMGGVAALCLQPDGKVIVSGYFTAIGGSAVRSVARLNADGSVDTGFNAGGAGPDYNVLSLALQKDGKIILGGGFTTVNGKTLPGVARLNADGSVDSQFTRGTGTAGSGYVDSVALTSDGGVLVGGTFTQFDGQARDGFARLYGGDLSMLSFDASSYTVDEAAGSIAVHVKRRGESAGMASVVVSTLGNTAKSGTDYTGLTQTLSWASGDAASKTFTIPIKDLQITDGSTRQFTVKLASATGATIGSPSAATITIKEDDRFGTLAFDAASYSVNENAGTVTVSVTRTNGSTGAVSVTAQTFAGTAKSGTDYTGIAQTLSWSSGDTAAKKFSVSLKDSGVTDGSTRTFSLKLSSPGGGAALGSPAAATVTIKENDPAQGELEFAAANYSVNETAGTLTVQIKRVVGSTGAVSATCATTGGTAKSGTDYTGVSKTVSWTAGDTAAKSFTVTIKNRGASGGKGLKFSVVLSSATGGAALGSPATATVTIN